MEMVSTAKSKKAMDRVIASHPYSLKIKELVQSLSSLSSVIESPYLRSVSSPKKVGILVITANRGLCGGYNSNVCKMAKARYLDLQSKGIETEITMVGKKGINFFRFSKIPVAKSYTNIDDKSGFNEANEFATNFMNDFASGKLDGVEIISTVFHSSANQEAGITNVLPVKPVESSGKSQSTDSTIFEPSPKQILEGLLPLTIKTAFLKAILEAVCSEHIARRMAMKSATDAASDMIKLLTRGYNRVRQAKITQEISEIVGGADSLQ
jgi:F-type H+-transporting ATPase subunit gamma